MKKITPKILSAVMAACIALGTAAFNDDAVCRASAYDKTFESYMTEQGFPESYKPSLREMHSAHPNWIFTAQKTGLDWNDVLNEECVIGRNLVHAEAPASWKSCERGAYDAPSGYWYGLDGTWVATSKQIISYYLDPRNFITDDYIFMFENQSYNPDVHTIDGVQAILSGTFMSGNYTCPDTGEIKNYAQTFMDAAAESGVSPYHLASRCRNEQGVYGAPQSLGTVPGYKDYFNFFDIQAYYTSTMTAGQMGCLFASSYNPTYYLPWTNQYKSIVGGSIYLGNGYITKGQDTLYLQKFDVTDGGNGLYYHQYMTCVFGQANEAVEMRGAYTDEVLGSAIEFKIPVYENMPSTLCEKPTSNYSNDNLLDHLDVLTDGGQDLLPNFYRYTDSFDITVDSSVEALTFNAVPYRREATVKGGGRIKLAYGVNTVNIVVTAGSGEQRTYTVNVTRKGGSSNNNTNTDTKSEPAIIKGDVNNDGRVDVTDSLSIMNYTTGRATLSPAQFARADIDGTGTVDVRDAMLIMQYVSGKISSL